MNQFRIKPPSWDSTDAATLKAFLETEVAEKLFFFLSEARPTFLDGADSGRTLFKSGEINGWDMAIEAIFELVATKPEEVKIPESYPPIDDEAAWPQPKTTT